MAVNQRSSVGYGLSDALPTLAQRPILTNRNPVNNDRAPLGTLWVNESANDVFCLTSIVNNVATWAQLTGSSGVFNTISLPNTNAAQTQGVIFFGGQTFIQNYGTANTFIGTASGNTTLTVGSSTDNTGVGDIVLASLTTGANNCAYGAGSLDGLTSGSNVSAFGVSSGSVYTVESNNIVIENVGTVGDAHTIRIGTQGSGSSQQNKCFIAGITGATPAATSQLTITDSNGQIGTLGAATNGQIAIGSTGASPALATITAGTGITVTNGANSITIATTASTPQSFTTDSGTAVPVADTLIIKTNNSALTCGSSVLFTGSTNVVQLQVSDSNANTIIGKLGGNATLTGIANTGLGVAVFASITSGEQNVAVGDGAMEEVTSSQGCVALGYSALPNLVTGINVIALGSGAAQNYTGAESNNIMIGHAGVLGESNVMRLGTTGTGAGQQDKCFVAGVTGVTPGATAAVTITDTNGQLGTLSAATNGQLLIGSTGANPAFATATSTGGSLTYTTGAHALNIDIANWVPVTSFTPGVAFGGGSTGITYTTQVGQYRRIGNMISVIINIVLSSKGSSTGSATITGLPVASGNTSTCQLPTVYGNLTFTGIPFSYTQNGTTINLGTFASGGAFSALANTNFGDTTGIYINGLYATV